MLSNKLFYGKNVDVDFGILDSKVMIGDSEDNLNDI